MNVFITGTDTDIGKTVVSAWICRNSSAKYWKPIQTGDDSDAGVVSSFSPNTIILPNAYRLKAPLSAYDAGNLEGIQVDTQRIISLAPRGGAVIEGAGGALVPVCDGVFFADLIKGFNAKVIVVAKSKLGFLNHIFMTVEALQARSVEILGIVLNGKTDLIPTIEKFSGCRVLAVLEDIGAVLRVGLPQEIGEVLV